MLSPSGDVLHQGGLCGMHPAQPLRAMALCSEQNLKELFITYINEIQCWISCHGRQEKVTVPSEGHRHMWGLPELCAPAQTVAVATLAPWLPGGTRAPKRVINSMITHKQPNLTTQGRCRQQQNGKMLPDIKIN